MRGTGDAALFDGSWGGDWNLYGHTISNAVFAGAITGAVQAGVVRPVTNGVLYLTDAEGAGGGGGGSTNLYGTSAARPATAASGTVYYASDGCAVSISDGATWRAFGRLCEVTMPQTSGWAWANQPSAGIDVRPGAWIGYQAYTGTYNNALWVTNVSGAWTLTARIKTPSLASVNQWGGIVERQTSDGKLRTFGLHADAYRWIPYAFRWPNTTTAVGADNAAEYIAGDEAWLRAKNDGTNRTYSLSADGRYWVTMYTTQATNYMTSDQCGFFWGNLMSKTGTQSWEFSAVSLTKP
jgi:hypothetical protein